MMFLPAEMRYDHQGFSEDSVQHYFSPQNEREPLVFAGLWDDWNEKNENIRSFTIITTTANDFMKPIHDRMPLILTGEQRRRWLADADAAAEILTVVPPELVRTSAESQISLW